MIRKVILKSLGMRWARLLPDKFYLQCKFLLKMGMRLDLRNPKTFNQKIQWLKLYDRRKYYINYVDKVKVREFIGENFGRELLIPQIGVYETFSQIDFSVLPKKFVIKPNHLSGKIYICEDKDKINIATLEPIVNSWLKTNYFWNYREWPYKFIQPKIIIEEFLEDNINNELIDYKIMCFNGTVKYSFIVLQRLLKQDMCVDFYDRNWNKQDFKRRYNISNKTIVKPLNYDLMIKITEQIGKREKFIRVDFYEVDGKLYFGEITLYPGAGFEVFDPIKWDYEFGKCIKL